MLCFGELPTWSILADNSKNLNELCQKASTTAKTLIKDWLIHINANMAPRVQTFTLAKN
jgi:Zn-dependent peptidase ImmA (M78 family)